MEISDSQLDTAIRNADAAGRIEDVQSLSREYNRRQKKKVINEDESINDNELETAIRNADKAGRTEDVQALAVEYNRRKQASEQDRGLVEEASYLADDFANQFNLGVANVIGAPVDLISFGLNKVSNAIIDEDIVSPDAFGGSASIKNAMKSIGTRDEAPRTKAGYIGGVSGEAVGFTMPLLKVAQTATKAQAVTKAGQVAQNVAKDFVDEAVNKTGRLLAIESGAATTAGLAREYAENEDLSPGTSLAVEILAGVAGGFAGAGAYRIPKSLLKKVQGKNATEIMEMVSNGTIPYKDLEWALESKPLFKDDGTFNMDAPATPKDKTQPLEVIVDGKKIPQTPKPTMPGVVRESFEFQAARQEIANNVSNKQKVEAAVALNNLDNYAPDAPLNPKRIINKILSVFAPSKLLGNDIVNEIEMAKGTINRAQELGARVKRVVGRLEKKDPTVRESLDVFLKGGEMAPSLEPVEVELIKWKETIQELQNTLLQGMDDEVFEGLSKAGKKEVLETIEASIEQGYLTQTYKIFQDPDYRPTKAQEDAALKEIQLKIMMGADAGTMTMPQAEDLARKQMDHLRKSSARQRKAEGRQQGAVKESKGILRERSNPGPAERAWLGEVKDPKERAFSTANRLARLASSKAEDVAIAKFLLDSGVATRRPANPDQVQMKFRTIEGDSSVFIDPEVAHSLDMLRFGEANTVKSGIAGYLDKIWNTWVGTSKSTKVLLNPESYMVNLFGAVASTISSGIIPTPKGFRAALSDFGSLDDLLSGKNTVGRRALLDDIDKMNQYGLKPKSVNAADIEQNVIRGLQGLNKSLKGGIKATMDWFGKAYSVGDTSMRYVVWKGNQRQLKKMFPDYSVAEIEAAAARLTNNTFQNYDKLSNIIRQVSRAGLADQFVPFTAELTRNMYNQGKYVAQMTAGTFGKDIGLDPTRANKIQMRLHAVKRGAALAAVTAGTDAAITQYNELKGVTNKDEEQFGFSIAPEWDSSKRLIIIPDETGRKGRYVNPSYLVPQGMAAQAFEAGFSGSPVSQLAEFVKDQYLGAPGTFPVRAIGQIISGRDLNGKLISVDPRTQEVAKDFMGVIYDETLKPGAQRTIERWSNSLSGIGDRTTKDNALRMLGIRDYQWDAEKSFTNKLREISEPMRQAKGTYSSALRKFTDNNIPREELDATYEEMNTARRLNMDIMRQHYKNLGGGTWKYSQDERIVMMKEAGVSSADILDIIENTYTDIPKVKAKQTYDIYEELGNTKKEREAAIREIAREDPLLARKLISHHKKIMRVELLKISEVDKLIRTQSPQKRAERLINMGAHKNRALMSEMMQKGIATPEVRHIIKLRAK